MNLEMLKEKITGFSPADFGDEITKEMQSERRPRVSPPVFPKRGEHPRVLFTKNEIEGLRAAMSRSSAKAAAELLRGYAEEETDGALPPAFMHDGERRGIYNYEPRLLSVIQSKALYYQISGNERYGLEAVLAMLNYIKTFDMQWLAGDIYREYGHVAYIIACVYDWCYDLLDEKTKLAFISAAEHRCFAGNCGDEAGQRACGKHPEKMEMGFPPDGQTAVVGHGSELQLQRDYLACAIAFYDEVPGWWEYIGGRYYNEYYPVRMEYYTTGMYPQGSAFYSYFRYLGDLFAIWLIKCAIGKNPYPECTREVIRALINHEAGGEVLFATGDGNRGVFSAMLVCEGMISSYLFDDPVMRGFAKQYEYGYSKESLGSVGISAAEMLICHSGGCEVLEDFRSGLPRIQYNGGYIGQMIARNKTGFDTAATLAKIQPRTTANHDHLCSGSFHIYYKGMLSTDTGGYARYGTDHWKYYHQGSISHNTLLVFNPAYKDSETAGVENGKVKNGDRFWYAGGQYRPSGEPRSYEHWIGGEYERAELTGVMYDSAKEPRFAYISGDITKAYNADTVDFVSRKMLTAYTESHDFPMLFFVCDRIDAKSGDFKKSFLLQVPGEDAPIIEGCRVTVARGEGKLVLTSLIGGDEINPIGGGAGKNYMICGTQCADASLKEKNNWGRVEISPALGKKNDILLNVIYVANRDEEKQLEAHLKKSADSRFVGAEICGICALFNTERGMSCEPIEFDVSCDGTSCYIGGVAGGAWQIETNGNPILICNVKPEEGFIRFLADTGKITVKKL